MPKTVKKELHIENKSGRALCGLPGGAVTSDHHTSTCHKCKKAYKASVKLNKALAPPPPKPIEEPADALELVERLKRACEAQKEKAAAQKMKLVPKPVVKKKESRWIEPKREITPATNKQGKSMPLCRCGCNEHTKGGVYRPGHDARHHSELRKMGAPIPLLHKGVA